MFRRSFLQKRHQTVVEFLVGSIMRTQEVIKCRTLFIHFLHVQRLPVQAANCVTVLKSLSSCFLAVKLKPFPSGSPLVGRSPLYRASRTSGYIKQMFPLGKKLQTTSSLLPCGCEDEHAAAFSLHNLQRMFTTKRLEEKTTAAVSKLAATQPTFNFRLNNSLDTFSSVTSESEGFRPR